MQRWGDQDQLVIRAAFDGCLEGPKTVTSSFCSVLLMRANLKGLQLNPNLSEINGSFLGRMKLLKLFLILLLSQLSLCQDDSQLPKDAGTYYLSG